MLRSRVITRWRARAPQTEPPPSHQKCFSVSPSRPAALSGTGYMLKFRVCVIKVQFRITVFNFKIEILTGINFCNAVKTKQIQNKRRQRKGNFFIKLEKKLSRLNTSLIFV